MNILKSFTSKIIRRKGNCLLLCLLLPLTVYATSPNVLFIAVDDLRVELGSYCSEHVFLHYGSHGHDAPMVDGELPSHLGSVLVS
jgi:hypothetical protein